MAESGQITQWLRHLSEGDKAALESLVPLMYDELRMLARKHLRSERSGHTLNTTALVNELYLKLVQQNRLDAVNRAHFLGIAGVLMRRLLRDYARSRQRAKRGGGRRPVSLETAEPFLTDEEADEILALDEALDGLEQIDPRACEVVQYRFFSGLSLDETAEALGVSVKTVQRDWIAARAWLRKEISGELRL